MYPHGMASLSATSAGPAPAVSRAATSGLARLLATENIRVEHQPIETAMFDTVSRTLTLPIWRGMSDDLYDMLVGHEVGHALWTPASEAVVVAAIARLRALGSPSDAHAKSILNIVEDARIERLIKDRFPGLRRNFAVAYRELVERDIFGLRRVSGDANALGFVDRFNLHHKCAVLGLVQVSFTPDERALVERGSTTETFEHVVSLCEDIVRHMAESGAQESDDSTGSGGTGSPDGSENGEGEGASVPGDESADPTQNSTGSGSDGTEPSTEDSPGAGNTAPAPAGERTDTDAEPVPQRGAPGAPGTAQDRGRGRTAQDGYQLGTPITTDAALAGGLGSMSDTRNGGYYNVYADAPNWNWEQLLVRPETVNALWREQWDAAPGSAALMDSLYDLWRRDNAPTVLNMVKRFEQRQAADEQRRTTVAKTGRIDTTRLAYYRVSEDLFLTNTTVARGRNHGLVMLVDWSGSMSGVIGSVVSQVLCLVEFCRRTGVPYEVYAFTDCLSGWAPNDRVTEWGDPEAWERRCAVTVATPGTLAPSGLRMVQFLRDGMSRAEHADAVRGLISTIALQGYEPFTQYLCERATALPGRANYRTTYASDAMALLCPGFRAPPALSLHGTPLNEALLASADLVERFRARTHAQIVNLAVLTDGEASRRVPVHGAGKPAHTGAARSPAVVLRHGARQYSFVDTKAGWSSRTEETNAIIRYVRERSGARVYGFFLMDSRGAQRYVSSMANGTALAATVKADGSVIVPHSAYDEYYVVGVARRTEDENFLDRVDAAAASPRKIANTFVRGMQTRSSSRTIMVRFTDCFATGKPSQHKLK